MSGFRRLFTLSLLLILFSACAGKPPVETEKLVFQHDFNSTTVPWTNKQFDSEAGKFSFAIFSDLTGGERDGVFAVAVEQLRLLRPELIISVGDLIDGESKDHGLLTTEWESFDERANRTRAPVFHVGGNHDLSHPELWEVWEQRHGQRYYHFVYKDVLFLVLDTEDNPPAFQANIAKIRWEAISIFNAEGEQAFIDSEYGQLQERKSGRIGAEQAAHFREVISRYPDVRWTFLFMHKPAWERAEEENFSTIEEALSDRPYSVFHGHLHSYHHRQRHGRDYIRLGTTGGSHASGDPMAIDHVTLVTVSKEGPDIANLRLSGIFDKTGKIPLNGGGLCLEGCAGK
ncbi:MAG: serine/threonine protein phosphatase [Gammaproteobacteria bacterium]|nr:serine/threonine protein phosphatase [Gammaproteobacteria bacterium]